MSSLRRLGKQTKLFVLENLYSRKMNIHPERAIFSFTFDDVPVSAMTNGARILEQAGATGTFYVALGMDNGAEGRKKFIDHEDIRVLHDRGHDIECHTFGHLNLRQNPAERILDDCNRNTAGLSGITGKPAVEHFAYPFGAVSPSGKKILRDKYQTLRTIDPGLNYGKTDMTHLRTVSLCSIDFDRQQVRDAIYKAVVNHAWVIFFSHDIEEQPSVWGLSPDDFAWVVNECRNSAGTILNVQQAYARITGTN